MDIFPYFQSCTLAGENVEIHVSTRPPPRAQIENTMFIQIFEYGNGCCKQELAKITPSTLINICILLLGACLHHELIWYIWKHIPVRSWTRYKNAGYVLVAWKSHGKWFLFSRPGIVMKFVKKSDKSHGFFKHWFWLSKNASNVYPPASLFLLYLVRVFWLLSHGFTWFGHGKVIEFYCALGAGTL